MRATAVKAKWGPEVALQSPQNASVGFVAEFEQSSLLLTMLHGAIVQHNAHMTHEYETQQIK